MTTSMRRTDLHTRLDGPYHPVTHVVAVVAVIVLVPVALTALPSLFGADRVVVADAAARDMQPTLQGHHAVFVERAPTADVQRGDVILYRRGSQKQFTRVALVTSVEGGTAFVTSADARARPREEPVMASAVRGRMALSMPYVGALVGAARATPILSAVVAGGLAVYELLTWGLLAGIVTLETRQLLGRVEQSLADAGDGGLEVTRADLTATTLALGLLATFAVGVFLSSPSPATLTVGILSVGLFGYTAVLWWTAPSRPGGDGLSVVTGSLQRTTDGRTTVRVQSPDTLAGMAAAEDRPLAVDPDENACFLPHGDVVYVSDGRPGFVENGA